MEFSHIKQMFRIIFRNKTYSILNIAGLAIGITCAALILLWVEDEMTYNVFPKKNQLYALIQHQNYDGKILSYITAPNPLAAVLNEEVPGIKNVTRYKTIQKSLFTLNDNKMLYESGAFSDSSIFSMFNIEFVKGNASVAFDAANPLVITEKMAAKFFGKDDPLGKTLKKDNEEMFQITAVIKDPKPNSDFTFSWLIPFRHYIREMNAMGWQNAETAWDSNWLANYVELEATADINQVNHQIKDMLMQRKRLQVPVMSLYLYPIHKLKLYGDFTDGQPTGTGYIRYVRMFLGIAIVILVIACINFMNLSTARSQKRIKEVGVRKTHGAKRLWLVRQFMTESGIITFASLLLAIIFILIALPPFNLLVDKNLALHFDKPVHWIGLLCVGLVCSVVAGSYPAFFLSSFPPLDMMQKLKAKGSTGVVWLRKGLVVFQFVASLTLIICTVFIYMQVQHTRNRSMGMNVEQVIMVEANQDIRNHFEPLKHELLATGVVEHTGLSTQTMLNLRTNNTGWKWQGKHDNAEMMIYSVGITDDLFPTLQISLHEGRNFEAGLDANTNRIIINKAFAEIMGEEGRIGSMIWRGENTENALTIIGIINDFVFNDMYGISQKPAVFSMDGHMSALFIRMKPGNTQDALQKVETVVKGIAPSHPFEYRFMDEEFGKMFQSTLLMGKLSGLFAALAVFISCLGLFGLTAFAAELRTREIGIRKVLGASVWNIVEMLGRNFMVLTGISFVFAIPLAWWIMHRWLQDYGYRIDLNWHVFAGCGLLVVMITMLTVGFQALMAATANPVKAIKME